MEKILMGYEELETEKGAAKISYYLTKEKKKEPIRNVFGIEIKKEDGSEVEIEYTGGISYCSENVEALLSSFMSNKITPMVLLELVDDLYEERLCS